MTEHGKLIFALLAVLALSGCASVAEEMFADYQCEREAANRPDEAQRRAECQMLPHQAPKSAP